MKFISKYLRILASPYFISFFLILIILLLITGTIVQIKSGLLAAKLTIFNSWFLWVGNFFILPGLKSIGIVLILILSVQLFKMRNLLLKPGLFLIHLSALLLIVSSFISASLREESYLQLKQGETVTGLFPSPIHLVNFTIDYWPGSTDARDYKSFIRIGDLPKSRTALISMNKPYQFKDYTLYQSSYVNNGDSYSSVLLIVKNRLQHFPYAIFALFITGIIFLNLSFFIKLLNKVKIHVFKFFTILILLFIPAQISASEQIPKTLLSEIGNIRIIHEGRIIPLKLLIRYKLFQYTAKSSISNSQALLMAEALIFKPQQCRSEELFSFHNTDLIQRIKGNINNSGLYSYNQIMEFINKAYSFPFTLNQSELKELNHTYNNMLDLDNLISKSTTDNHEFIAILSSKFKENKLLKDLTYYYQSGDCVNFKSTLDTIIASEKRHLGLFIWYKGHLELWYNYLNLKFLVICFYVLTSSLLLFRIIKSIVPNFISLTFIVALSFHTVLLVIRTVILMRPPVLTLYETFLIVAWFVSIAGLFSWLFSRNHNILGISSALTLFLILISGMFGSESSTMHTASAVLNSNFWLTVHILTIIAGYTAFLLTFLQGHIFLLQKKLDLKFIHIKLSTMYKTLLSALVLTTVGTLLGGLWADISWGRFWGWDPKENGALLLIVWGILLTHSLKSRIISDTIFAWGNALCGGIVLFTWVGVNMLGKGLHTYGFSYNGLLILILYVLFELLFCTIVIFHGMIKTKIHNISSKPVKGP